MFQFIEPDKTYYQIVFSSVIPRTGKKILTGPGVYFPTKLSAEKRLEKTIIRHPDAYIVVVRHALEDEIKQCYTCGEVFEGVKTCPCE